MRRLHLLSVLLVSGLIGCGGTGRVEVLFDLPETAELDPFAQTIDELTLSAYSGDELVYRSTRPLSSRAHPPVFDEIPLASQVRLELSAKAPSGREVAFGRSDDIVDVTAEDTVEIRIPVRRPFAFLAGSDQLLAVDATREPGQLFTTALGLAKASSAAAALPDGTELAIATQDTLQLVPTSSFDLSAAPSTALVGPAEDLAVSPDGRWAVATHRGDAMTMAPSGVSVIDLDALRSGSTTATFIATDTPGAVALTNDTAWVVIEPLASLFCEGDSRVLPLDLATASPKTEIDLDAPAGDIAAHPSTGALVVLPCADTLINIAPGATSTTVVQNLRGISAVTVARDRIWMAGHVDGEGAAHLSIASAPLQGGSNDVLELSVLEERAIATDLADVGQGGLLQMQADLASAFDISVLPDGAHAAVLVASAYTTNPLGDAGGGQPIIPRVTMVTYEYQLVQLDTGLGAQRLRVFCEIMWDPGALLDDFECAKAPGQDESAVQYLPTDLSTLFGSR